MQKLAYSFINSGDIKIRIKKLSPQLKILLKNKKLDIAERFSHQYKELFNSVHYDDKEDHLYNNVCLEQCKIMTIVY